MLVDPTIRSITTPTAQAVLEAGGEDWPALIATITSRMEGLAPGQVLEVITPLPVAQIDTTSWCQATRHEMVGMLADGGTTRLWIRKWRRRGL